MSKHTPGPWIRVVAKKEGSLIRFDTEKKVEQLCSNGLAAVMILHDGSEEGEANARLISAAPELLEALKSIEDLPVDDEGDRIIPAGFLDQARAAIKKAEG